MEREVLVSGVGGQGIQLASQTLARAAALEGREVTLFGVYGGSMRGGNTDSTVVIGNAPIEAAPIVSRAWSAIVMSLRFWEPSGHGTGMSRKLVPGGLVLLNSSLAADGGPDPERYQVIEVAASDIASRAGRELGQSMVMLGAYAKVTDVVGFDSLVEGMTQSLPDYRRQHVAANADMLRVGYEVGGLRRVPFWDVPVIEPVVGPAVQEAR
jgi:Pyruvate/2-oxoacid:ferredoxin oxidoreductase gamma subunit